MVATSKYKMTYSDGQYWRYEIAFPTNVQVWEGNSWRKVSLLDKPLSDNWT